MSGGGSHPVSGGAHTLCLEGAHTLCLEGLPPSLEQICLEKLLPFGLKALLDPVESGQPQNCFQPLTLIFICKA